MMGRSRGIGAIIVGIMLLFGVSGNGWAVYHVLRALLIVVT